MNGGKSRLSQRFHNLRKVVFHPALRRCHIEKISQVQSVRLFQPSRLVTKEMLFP